VFLAKFADYRSIKRGVRVTGRMGSLSNNIGRAHAEGSVLNLLSDFNESRSGDAYMIIAAIVLIAMLFIFKSVASKHKRIPSANVFANFVGFSGNPVDYLSITWSRQKGISLQPGKWYLWWTTSFLYKYRRAIGRKESIR
jgi:hypothetical protein